MAETYKKKSKEVFTIKIRTEDNFKEVGILIKKRHMAVVPF